MIRAVLAPRVHGWRSRRWRVEVEPDSAPVSLASANGLDDPEIDARVGRGASRTLRYRIKPVAGQKVVPRARPERGHDDRRGDRVDRAPALPARPRLGREAEDRRRRDPGRRAARRIRGHPLRRSRADAPGASARPARGAALVVRGVPRRGRAVVQVRGVLNTGLVGRPAVGKPAARGQGLLRGDGRQRVRGGGEAGRGDFSTDPA
jgi:hypothetical protein